MAAWSATRPFFRVTDGQREIGHDAIGIGFACVAVEAGREINGENLGVGSGAQPIDFARGVADRLAQCAAGASAEQAIDDDERRVWRPKAE